MIFTRSQIPNPVNIPFNWVADYFNGSYLSEYDFKTHKANSFYSIDQEQTVRFRLVGNGMKFFFETIDGHFHLNGRRLDIAYANENGKVFNLTNNTNQKDLITYKQAYTDFNQTKVVQSTNIESINFGYKTTIKKNDIQLFFQPIVSLPFGSSAFIEIKLTSNKNLNGYLVFYVSGKERERFFAPLESGKSGQLNWTIK